MKNLFKYIFGALAILVVIIACTKEVGLYTEVEFEISETHVADGFINSPLATSITVTPEELVEGYSYSYSYKINSGEGYFQDESGASISEGEKTGLSPLSANLNYIPKVVGDHSVTFTVVDAFGFKKVLTITYTITNVAVSWTATGPTGQVLLGSSQDIIITLGSETIATGVTYERNYSFTQGTGTITSSPSGASETFNEFISITPGTYTLTYVATELGQTTLAFLLKDSNGQEIVQTISFQVINKLDTTAPVITLIGGDISLAVGDAYTDAGANANDDVDGDITSEIDIVNPVDPDIPGTYTVTYNVSDAAGNDATEVIRTVIVSDAPDTTAPIITRNGPASISLTVGDAYTDAGATANDDVDGDITSEIDIINLVDPDVAGTYTVTYNVSDVAGNDATEVIRTVIVSDAPDTTAPIITRNGPASISLTVGDVYTDAGATANDDVDGDITSEIDIINLVDPDVAGTYTVTYNVSDAAGNDATEVIRTVVVSAAPDTTAPIITRNGPASISLTVGDAYTDAGATANDDVDGDITSEIDIINLVDPDVAGTYTVTYNVSDAAGNDATEVIRTIIVSDAPDTTAPIITRNGLASISLTVGDAYTDAGATANDDVDGDITSEIDIINLVDPDVAGTYTVTYNVSDAAGNDATEVIRTVIVNEPKGTVTYSTTTSINESEFSITGTLTISGGSLSFELNAFGGSKGASVFLNINGAPTNVSVGIGASSSNSTGLFGPGTYTYTLEGVFRGGDGVAQFGAL
ncbi:DUF5011 domain-containing protein [Cellulophaga sp. HaHa_2_1]|uniref:DUF5011 domain-containing protein n=1 Tax=Cellulophaga sp. HaHa_2_1 TaxID=2749994 RepID=UPI001C4EFCB7|nr:DUF5011 domain-containing protein [Cellulophaga sp. HaHa_2_1]QXP52978.1 DUF5011 domain-containing protein [Cellulophaga sp. HaHa_2_1]